MVPTGNRWHSQNSIIWAGFIYNKTVYKDVGIWEAQETEKEPRANSSWVVHLQAQRDGRGNAYCPSEGERVSVCSVERSVNLWDTVILPLVLKAKTINPLISISNSVLSSAVAPAQSQRALEPIYINLYRSAINLHANNILTAFTKFRYVIFHCLALNTLQILLPIFDPRIIYKWIFWFSNL